MKLKLQDKKTQLSQWTLWPQFQNIGYQWRHLEIVDYQLYSLRNDNQTYILRGPQPNSFDSGNYGVCIGAAYTFGAFVARPYPNILAEKLGVSQINMGIGGAGPNYFLRENNDYLLELANKAKFTVVLVMSGRSQPSLVGAASGRGGPKVAEKFRRLINKDRASLLSLVYEVRTDYVKDFIKLSQKITSPKILLWFSRRQPNYEEGYKNVNSLFGDYPHLVNQAMVDEIKVNFDEYVECYSTQGIPERLISRFTGQPTTVVEPNKNVEFNYYATSQMHEDAAELLAPVCKTFI